MMEEREREEKKQLGKEERGGCTTISYLSTMGLVRSIACMAGMFAMGA